MATDDKTGANMEETRRPSRSIGRAGAALLGAGIGVATLTGAVLVSSTFAGAESAPVVEDAAGEHAGRLAEALAPLVEDGTITQAQADAVIERLREAGAEHRGERGERREHRRQEMRASLEAAAELLGMTPEELRDAVRGGSTLADLASEQGIGIEQLVDVMTAPLAEHLAQAVSDGRITQEQADTALERAVERLTAFLNGERPERPMQPAEG